MWDQDIKKYAEKTSRDPARIEGILIRSGWEREKYLPEMQSRLFDWLDQWYTLSNKNVPPPATQDVRSNPVEIYRRFTRLPNGWTILTQKTGQGFLTRAANGDSYYDSHSLTRDDANSFHLAMIERVMHG